MKSQLCEFLPDPAAYQPGRLFCLDLVRGLDIFFLTVLTPWEFFRTFFRALPFDTSHILWWDHRLTAFVTPDKPLYGFNITDFAQPLFIFICGAAVPFAIPKRLTPEGRPTAAYWKHVFARVGLLWLCGSLIRGILKFDLPHSEFSLYCDTLHTIAVAYLGASLAQLVRGRGCRLAIALVLIAVFGVVQATCGDWTMMGNASIKIDLFLKRAICGGEGREIAYCYFLTTLPWLAMGIFGSLAADILRSARSVWRKAGTLAAWGAASCLLGLFLRFVCAIPMIRYIYTVSFIFETMGLSCLLVAALYVVTDIWQFRKGTGLFLLFGQCSLAAWMLMDFFGCGVLAVAKRITIGVPHLLGTDVYQEFTVNLVRGILVIVLVAMWRKYRMYRQKEKQGL